MFSTLYFFTLYFSTFYFSTSTSLLSLFFKFPLTLEFTTLSYFHFSMYSLFFSTLFFSFFYFSIFISPLSLSFKLPPTMNTLDLSTFSYFYFSMHALYFSTYFFSTLYFSTLYFSTFYFSIFTSPLSLSFKHPLTMNALYFFTFARFIHPLCCPHPVLRLPLYTFPSLYVNTRTVSPIMSLSLSRPSSLPGAPRLSRLMAQKG